MDLVADQLSEGAVDELVARKRPLALELLGDNECLEMVVIVARDADRGICEAFGNQFFNLGGFHVALSMGYFSGGAQFNRKFGGFPTCLPDCV